MVDVLIVGGSNAGLSAALVLGRSRRRVVVIDHQQPRNAPSAHMYNFLSRDGLNPAEFRRISREQLRAYNGVEFVNGEAVTVAQTATGFDLTLDDGRVLSGRKVLLATGVVDELPPIPGLAEHWGHSVFHCPYCHGWEVRDQPLAIIGTGQHDLDLTQMVYQWSKNLVLCTNGASQLADAERHALMERGIGIREEPITQIADSDAEMVRIEFASGPPLQVQGLFIRPSQRQRSLLSEQLGCAVQEGPLPHLISVGMLGQTSVAGVYAAGDSVTMLQQAIAAAAGGAAAAAAINRELVMEEWAAVSTPG